MEEINHSFNWGGFREGAGQKPKWNHGKTVTIRVPQMLVDDINYYARLIDGQFPNGLQIPDCLSCKLQDDNVTQSRNLVDQLEKITQERNQLNQECNELADKVGMLHLEIESLKEKLDTDTQSNVLQELEELMSKVKDEKKGYKRNGFSQGLKDLDALLNSIPKSF